ncbi:MAG: thioredoxin [Limisphaerales bacterium]
MIIEVNQANYESEVLNSDQTVIVNFWAKRCRSSKMLAPVLDEIAMEYIGRVKITRMNVDENPALAKQHHIGSTPTLLFFSNGQVHDELVGIQDKQAIITKLETFSFAA